MLTSGLTEIEVPVQQSGKSVLRHRTAAVRFSYQCSTEMLCFGPLTHQDRTGATFDMCDQSLFHGEGVVAMTAGQTTLNHIMVRNKREGSRVNGLMFTAQVPNQCFPANGFKAQWALELLRRFRNGSCWREAEHLLNGSGRLQLLLDLSRWCSDRITRGGIMIFLHVVGQSCGGEEGHLTTSAFMQTSRSIVSRLRAGC